MTTREYKVISRFVGPHAFLSNFYEGAPFRLPNTEAEWPTAEHCFQACKAVTPDEFEWVRSAPTPSEAKKRGRLVTAQPDWEKIKRRVMLNVVMAKFVNNPGLMRRLVATHGVTLIEGNTWGDTYWGATRQGGEHVWVIPGGSLYGYNWLGQILMFVRTIHT
jgi:N-glycosidase YbiA